MRALKTALLVATSLTHLQLTAHSCALLPRDADELQAAARRGWRRRALAFLMGSHPRLGAASCVALLPGALLQTVVELAEQEGACRLGVTLRAAAPPPAAAGPSVFGDDLAAIASMVG